MVYQNLYRVNEDIPDIIILLYSENLIIFIALNANELEMLK